MAFALKGLDLFQGVHEDRTIGAAVDTAISLPVAFDALAVIRTDGFGSLGTPPFDTLIA